MDMIQQTPEGIDVTIPTCYDAGKLHPISQGITYLKNIMSCSGFIEEEGPCIETEEYNFDALNVSKIHPARGMHDTFYLQGDKILRTHTSGVQIRVLKANKYQPPFAIYHLGQVYRRDSSKTHSPMFHQLEGLYVGDVSFAHLKGCIEHLLTSFFNQELIFRFRPSYFPFTEPSTEVDILCHGEQENILGPGPKERWLEVLGAGMVRKNILNRYGYESNAYAMGFGVERLVMLKQNISNINDFYKNTFPFLQNQGVRS